MSVLILDWSDTELRLHCKPDPARGPVRLDKILTGFHSGSAAAGQCLSGESLNRLRARLQTCCIGASPTIRPEHSKNLFDAIADMVDRLNSSSEACVLLLGQVTHLGIIAPSTMTAIARRALSDLLGRSSLFVTVICRLHSSVIGAAESLPLSSKCLHLEWSENLLCNVIQVRADRLGVERLIPIRSLARVGRGGMSERVRRLESSQKGRQGVAAANEDNSNPTSPIKPPLRSGVAFPNDDFESRSWAQICTSVESFVRAQASVARTMGVQVVVVGSVLAECPDAIGVLNRALTAVGMPKVDVTSVDPAVLGAFKLINAPPVLPYDCGVLLREKDHSNGVGTLLLVCPSPVGVRADSEPFVLRSKEGQSYEISFYTRRIDHSTGDCVYEVMRSHLFAPKVNVAGEIQIVVSMRVEADSSGTVSISADIHDLNAGDHIYFQQLPLVALSPLDSLPVRSSADLVALSWKAQFNDVFEKFSSEACLMSVAEWRGRLNPSRGKFDRGALVRWVMSCVQALLSSLQIATSKPFDIVAKGVSGGLQNDEFVSNSEPETIQKTARAVMFASLKNAVLEGCLIGGTNCVAWRNKYHSVDPSERNEQSVRDAVNALSQDFAKINTWDSVVETAGEMPQIYHLSCLSAKSLNIDW